MRSILFPVILIALTIPAYASTVGGGSLNSNSNNSGGVVNSNNGSNNYNSGDINITHSGGHNDTMNNVQSGSVEHQQKHGGYVTSPQVATGSTCRFGTGNAISAAGIGISAGKTFVDEGCERRANETLEQNQRRANVTLLNNIGLKGPAISLMCQDKSVRKAMKVSLDAESYELYCAAYDATEEEVKTVGWVNPDQ